MRYELFLAARYLSGLRRQQPVVSVIAGISVIGIALGVAALMTVLGVMSGFDADLEERIIGATPHLLVQKDGGIRDVQTLLERIERMPGVVAAAPVFESQALLRRGPDAIGVLLRGVDAVREPKVTRLAGSIREGSWPPGPGELVVGAELARRWGLQPGDPLEVVGGQKGKGTPLKVAAVFSTGMYDYDVHLTLAALETVQEIAGAPGVANGVGVRLERAIAAEEMKRELQQALGYPYWVMSWMDRNSNLFAALKLEKVTMFVILTLIVLVACFNIVATLLMMVVGKTKEIGILKAVGATNAGVQRVFMLAGFLIGLAGTALGTVAGLGLCAALKKYQFIQLPADIYYIDHLPVKLDPADLCAVAGAAVAISLLVSLYPSWVAARLEPAQALRYE